MVVVDKHKVSLTVKWLTRKMFMFDSFQNGSIKLINISQAY